MSIESGLGYKRGLFNLKLKMMGSVRFQRRSRGKAHERVAVYLSDCETVNCAAVTCPVARLPLCYGCFVADKHYHFVVLNCF